MPLLSIERRDVESRPVLLIRRRVARTQIAATIGECLGKLFGHCHAAGVAPAGQPFARYPETASDVFTVEVGVPVAAASTSAGDVEASTLQGGPAAVAVHAGSYDTLSETYGALERWIGEQGLRPAGAPWEVYVTDPTQHPNQADWRTEVYWPVA